MLLASFLQRLIFQSMKASEAASACSVVHSAAVTAAFLHFCFRLLRSLRGHSQTQVLILN